MIGLSLLLIMVKQMPSDYTEFDQTDHLIAYLIDKLSSQREGGKGILTIALAKLLFLIDYEHFKATRKQATTLAYTWYKHGPYSIEEFEPRLAKLEGHEIVRLPMTREVDGREYSVFRKGPKPRFVPFLPDSIKEQADKVIFIFGPTSWEQIVEYVYSLDFARRIRFGKVIDFAEIVATPKPDEALVDTVIDAFREELLQPMSSEHMKVVQDALQEPTNENIETAKKMLSRQRRAFRIGAV
jgi:hypothetical protein